MKEGRETETEQRWRCVVVKRKMKSEELTGERQGKLKKEKKKVRNLTD